MKRFLLAMAWVVLAGCAANGEDWAAAYDEQIRAIYLLPEQQLILVQGQVYDYRFDFPAEHQWPLQPEWRSHLTIGFDDFMAEDARVTGVLLLRLAQPLPADWLDNSALKFSPGPAAGTRQARMPMIGRRYVHGALPLPAIAAEQLSNSYQLRIDTPRSQSRREFVGDMFDVSGNVMGVALAPALIPVAVAGAGTLVVLCSASALDDGQHDCR